MSTNTTPSGFTKQHWAGVVLLLILFAQAAFSGGRTSLTIDEGLHITSGYSMWRSGDYRLVEEHPPLAKLLATWPLLLVPDLPSPAGRPGWDESNLVRVMKSWLQPYRPFDRLVFAARVPIMLLSVLLGALVFRWASDLAGRGAGLLAVGLYILDPNIIAHSAVAATDLGMAAGVYISMYTFWRTLRRPTRTNVALSGLALGLAQATKISALMLVPLFVALILARALTARNPALLRDLHIKAWAHTTTFTQRLARLSLVLMAVGALASLSLWAVYGFELRTPPGWAVPLPAASHLIPLERVRTDLSAGRTTFLMGQYSEHGWWYYFPVAFALKTPLPTLILLVLAVVSLALTIARPFLFRTQPATLAQPAQSSRLSRPPAGLWDALVLLAFPLSYFAVSLTQTFNIGYRHLLPVLPFLFVFIGVYVPRLNIAARPVSSRLPGVAGLAVCALLAWCALGNARIFPHYLAYFNELAGGPEGGYHYLVDSNLDWGQGWKELKAYMDAHAIARIKFAQFSSNDPATYGIAYEPIAPMENAPPVLPARFNPAPGVYVLSASSLQGVPLADINTYDYFRHRTPTARIGYALFVYDVRPPSPRPAWVASCAAPTPPLEASDLTEGFGRDDLRLLIFDCQQSWVFPPNSPQGWVVLPYAIAHDPSAFSQRWATPAKLSFEQKQSFALPPHSIFAAPGVGFLPSINGLTSQSARLGESVDLIAYAVENTTVQPGQTVALLTLWRVVGAPPGSLSVMAHLVNDQGQTLAVGDGLGFTAEQWQRDDIFIQRNALTLPPDAPAGQAWLYTGMYTLQNVQRLAIAQNGQVIGDSLRLAAVNIKP